MGLYDRIFKPAVSRRRFLQATAASGAAASLVGGQTLRETQAQATPAAKPETKITKNICHQCPARCGIDVYTTDGRVHAIYGNTDHPIANGKLCPKGPLGTYILYDPDRFKGPMKRTNPKKGRNEDPKFVPITWDEALQTVADRLQALRDKGESHRFALCYGRGWGASCAGLQGTFGALYGSPNVAIGHSSMCSDGSIKSKQATDGNGSYNAYDYRNTNYLLMFGCGFLEAFRPYNYLMQVWGYIRGEKSPKTRVTAVDVHMNTTMAASDRALLIKPGTDGALALAIAHYILVNGLWEKTFVGDFKDGVNRFKAGQTVDPALFDEKWVKGLVEWWNVELKDRTPQWASEITTILERDIVATAREFGTTRPALAIFERGVHAHSNGIYNGMAVHSLNALVGSLFAKGGMMYQMGPSYGPMPVDAADYMDDYAKNGPWKSQPRIDLKGHEDGYLLANNMLQEVGPNSLAGKPYKLDTIMFYLTNPVWTAPNGQEWEKALAELFVIDTSPFPGETAMMADLILPDHTYLERLQDAPTYPFEGWPMAQLRVPAIKPLYDTKYYGDVLIEIGKRMKGPMGEYYKALKDTENVIRHLAKGFEKDPGDNGVKDFESWKEKGVWYKKPYLWQQRGGEFYEWDGKAYAKPMTPDEVKAKLLKTPSGKFEFRSGWLEAKADWIAAKTGRDKAKLMFPHWEEPTHPGGGDLYVVTPKVALHAEGRGGNIPIAISLLQPTMGGRDQVYIEIHPETARKRGIADGDRVRIKSSVGAIEGHCRYFEGVRPDTLVFPMEHGHWAQGRWAKGRGPGHCGEVTVNQSDRITGQCNYYTTKVTIEKA
ncbi:molybdopterin-dependent oxidoreductase [Calidifontimicrobium sp. SYSU G02091]|uniref:molybdopterin-dependent oxidoreductase n=1 Tax=Calidifontimicrobium sp. SYSU G02091 TaxID=2926421 RepID=UPI001F535859|nr:molybdopterin-dependent oxidoreductase [Calidifontimicrobium sp. SYSU G02091]MCI1193497.1 molybdopterin-dependent oxidoreductase [Calidifontimicrobium sp. SYSU G02091]